MNDVLAVTFCILHCCLAVVASSTNEVLVVCYVTHCFAVMVEASSVNDVLTFALCMPHFCLGANSRSFISD